VWSNDHNVDPVGACVGARGGRVRMVVNEMRGEKIDIVPFSDDVADFVAKALSPAKVTQVILSSDGTQADVIVPDHQLSLAIGREGQNARLSARLTGVRVDIRSETQLAEGVPSAAADSEPDVEYADGEWVANRETGEMEWHEADGSVISESAWQDQQAAAAAAARAEAHAAHAEAATAAPAPDAAAAPAAPTAVAQTDDQTEPAEAFETAEPVQAVETTEPVDAAAETAEPVETPEPADAAAETEGAGTDGAGTDGAETDEQAE
jgi:N utilization substance protein A